MGTLHPDVTIRVDTREQQPLRFPSSLRVLTPDAPLSHPRPRVVRLHTVKEKMETGDYELVGFEGRGVVERKKNLRELAGNLLGAQRKRDNFIAEMTRLQTHTAPVIALEGYPHTLGKAVVPADADFVRDALHRMSLRYRVPVVFIPPTSKLDAGAWVASFLIQAAYSEEPDGS